MEEIYRPPAPSALKLTGIYDPIGNLGHNIKRKGFPFAHWCLDDPFIKIEVFPKELSDKKWMYTVFYPSHFLNSSHSHCWSLSNFASNIKQI